MTTITETNHIERIVIAFNGDTDGSFKGAAAERFSVLYRDGVEIFRKPGKGVTITEMAAEGFTWPAVTAEINTGMLLTLEAQAAQIDALTAGKATAEAARDAALAQVADLQAQLAALQPPSDVNGVPQIISKRQGRAQLKSEGLLAPVEAYIASLPADDDTRMAYEDAATWVRTDADVIAMLQLLGKTTADADAFSWPLRPVKSCAGGCSRS